jgi:hypothetical protein
MLGSLPAGGHRPTRGPPRPGWPPCIQLPARGHAAMPRPGRPPQPLPVILATFRRGERVRSWAFASWPPASASTARSRISFQIYRLPRKKNEKKIRGSEWHRARGMELWYCYRRRPTPACAGVGRQISRIFPAPLLRLLFAYVPHLHYTRTIHTVPNQPAPR